VHVPLQGGLVGLWLKFNYGFRYVLTEHYGIYNDIVEDSFSGKSFRFRRLVRKVIRESAVFLPVSKYLGEAVNEIVVAKPYTVIYNTVNTNFFRLPIEKESAKLFRFIHVSGMEDLKNVDGIINAAESLSKKRNDFELCIVGKLNPRMEQLAREKKLLNKIVFFTGEIKYEAVALEMQQAKSLILFSRIENMPCVILEALCCGLPVIATKVGGIPEVIDDKNGMLIDSENEDQLLNAMSATIDEYQKFDREKISLDAVKKFSYETIGAQMTQVYASFLENNH
jgi:glycosyltransferase involved in cell wall biosynthesis